jgi:DNA-binding GntR family transcriptional regulator
MTLIYVIAHNIMEIKMNENKQLTEELKAPKKERKQVVRHKENPFLNSEGEAMDLPVGKKGVRLTTAGKASDTLSVINHGTGEEVMTNVIAYKKVDSEQFIKLFTRNIALTFELTGTGIKALGFLAWSLQNQTINKDVVALDKYAFDDFMEEHPNILKSKYNFRTLQRGIVELIDSGIVARHKKPGNFFINPYFIFNGNRIAFTNVIEKDTSKDHGQKDLLQNE